MLRTLLVKASGLGKCSSHFAKQYGFEKTTENMECLFLPNVVCMWDLLTHSVLGSEIIIAQNKMKRQCAGLKELVEAWLTYTQTQLKLYNEKKNCAYWKCSRPILEGERNYL